MGEVQLKRVGDGALILDGFYPERAHRLRVDSTYFRAMGQAAYANLSARLLATGKAEQGKFFDAVADSFAQLSKILRAARPVAEESWGMRILGHRSH